MLSIKDLQTRIGAGALTSAGAIEMSRSAIAERDVRVGAFVRLAEDAPPGHGPLAGIAVAAKDVIDTADMATEMGSPVYAGWRPRADAPVIAALRRAGATIVGKAATTAFANADPAETRNPHDPAHTPGGSSAGSAAAVGAGMVPLALGTQTAGSVIRPASFCGAAAIKPSFRLIPTVGVKCLAWTLDTVGLFAAGVEDLALALGAITGRRATQGGVVAPRIGIVRQDFAGGADPDGEVALEAAAAAASRAGARIVEIAPPPSIGQGWAAQHVIQAFEASLALGWEYDHHRDRLGPKLRENLDEGRATTAEAYDEARRAANRARRDCREMFLSVDALLTYSAPGAAPKGLGSTGDARLNRIWTLLGTPAVNVPGLRDPAGLPIGVQVVAPFGQDALALDIGRFVEASLPKG